MKLPNAKLILFTRPNCGLCTNIERMMSKYVPLSSINIVDITLPKHEDWFDKYCYNVPVIHIEKKNEIIKLLYPIDENKFKSIIEKSE